jgi:integrase
LVAKGENFGLQGGAGPKTRGDQSQKCDEKRVAHGDKYGLTNGRKLCVFRLNGVFGRHRLIAIRQTFVHLSIQPGAKTKLSRSRVEAPKLLLDVLSAWRRETRYANENDFVFPSEKLGGKQPRSGSQLVEDYLRPAAIRAGVIRAQNGITYGPDGEVVKRFGFHTLRHSLATCMMDEQENPAVVQAIMRHSKMDMTLYYYVRKVDMCTARPKLPVVNARAWLDSA